MRSFRRLSIVCAATLALAACSWPSGRQTTDADILRDKIDRGFSETEIERDYGLTAGRLYVTPERNVRFQVLTFGQLRDWGIDDHGAALQSFRVSCATILNMRSATTLGGIDTRIEDWRQPCLAAQNVDPRAARAFFESAFVPVRLAPGERALVTAYFEPELMASRRPGGEFVHPLYARPPEIVNEGGEYGVVVNGSLQPYFSRGDIYRGALAGRGLEIAYLNDATDAFFLHVQGSGRLRFQDGGVTRVGFSAKNGHEYRSVGREMIRRGLTTEGRASAQIIQAYVRSQPSRGLELLSHNQSFIFFRELSDLDPNRGPVGALGVQLTDGRSIAVDRRFTPLGAPVWLETDDSPMGPMRRLVVAQDTGSAIQGVQRADFFWGTGAEAGALAGRMRHQGEMTVLLPLPTVQRLVGRSGP